MSSVPATPRRIQLLAAVAVLWAAAALVLTDGNGVAAVAPPLLVALLAVLARAPSWALAVGFLGIGLAFDDVRSQPFMGLWRSPFHGAGTFLYDGLDKSLGLPGLKIMGIELLLLGAIGLLLLRRFFDRSRVPRLPAPMTMALWCAGGAVLLMELWGLARGGDARSSLLQMRPMLLAVLATGLFGHMLHDRRHVRWALGVILAVGLFRATLGIYFWRAVLARTDASDLTIGGGSYIYTHADTVLWVTGVLICLAAVVVAPSRRTLLLNLTVTPVLGVAIVANNRRLAIVALLLGLMVIYALGRAPLRRAVNRIALATLPVVVIYVAVGWNASGLWARPVRVVKSLVQGGDTSASMRDIENYNLYLTAKRNPLLGSGLGHQYVEQVQAIDISQFLETYRYMPHNSLLWLVGAGGLVGFTLYWMPFVVGVFLAARLVWRARDAADEVLGLVAVTTVSTTAVQFFGDCGVFSRTTLLVVALFLGLAATRAAQIGAWPGRGTNRGHAGDLAAEAA